MDPLAELNNPFTDEERPFFVALQSGGVSEADLHDAIQKWLSIFWLGTSVIERRRARAKLFNLSGVFRRYPVERLRALIPPPRIDDSSYSFVVKGSAPEIHGDYCELPIKALDAVKSLNFLLSVHGIEKERSLFATLSEGREQRPAEYIVFMRELISKEGVPITASSEPLTKTIFIRSSATDDSKSARDNISLIFDLVMQYDFLKSFYNAEGPLDPKEVQARMRLTALEYILRLWPILVDNVTKAGLVKWGDADDQSKITPGSDDPVAKEVVSYLEYIQETLIKNTVTQLLSDELLGPTRGRASVELILDRLKSEE